MRNGSSARPAGSPWSPPPCSKPSSERPRARSGPVHTSLHGTRRARETGRTVADGDDDRALGALYRAHADFVWRVARALGVPEALVDDVVHDVFFVVRRRLATLEPGRSARPWLAGIT